MFHAESRGKRIAESLVAFVKKLDDTRAVTTAVSHSPATAPANDAVDVIGVNYNWDSFEALHKKYPEKAIMSSECCAVGSTRGWYFGRDDERGFLPAYDVDSFGAYNGFVRESTWRFIAERDWIMGGYQWIAFEHRGEAVWPRLCSQSGAIDLYMQKKDAFYQNLSHFSTQPVIHVVPHWNFEGMEGEPIQVWVYTNAPYAELLLNGVSCGRQNTDNYRHGHWSVPYAAGELVALGYDKDGNVVAKDKRVTAGKGVKLSVTMDTNCDESKGGDVALFTCRVLDCNGNAVPTATPYVEFLAEGCGRIYSTGSSVSDHTGIFSTGRRMYAGTVSVAVRLSDKGGELKVIAYADGLTPAVYKTIIEN